MSISVQALRTVCKQYIVDSVIAIRQLRYRVWLDNLCEQNRDSNIVIAFGPYMGDTIYSLAYLKYLSEKKHTIFVCADRVAWLCQYYDLPNVDVMPVKFDFFSNVQKMLYMSRDKYYIDINVKRNLYLPFIHAYCSNHFLYSCNTTLLEMLRKAVFDISEKCVPQRPSIPIKAEEGKVLPKSILVSPYSNTTRPIDIKVWTDCCEKMANLGYTVYTNCASEQDQAIPGTHKIVMDLVTLYSIIDQFDAIIGLRSGFQDLLIDRAKSIICIITGGVYPMFTLKQWDTKAYISEIVYRPDRFEDDLLRALTETSKNKL